MAGAVLSSEVLIGGMFAFKLTHLVVGRPGSLTTWASVELSCDMTVGFLQSKERERAREREDAQD